jgi:hypothetical protein
VDQLVGTFGENRGADTDLAQGRRTRAQMATQSARRPARGNGEENRSSGERSPQMLTGDDLRHCFLASRHAGFSVNTEQVVHLLQ